MSGAVVRINSRFHADLRYLALAGELARTSCRALATPVDEQFEYDVELAVSEAVTNAIKYAGAVGDRAEARLEFELHPNRLEVRVYDPGEPFSLDDVPPPDFDGVAAGGYGLYIIRNVMDRVQLLREGEWNVLVMEKRLPPAPSTNDGD